MNESLNVVVKPFRLLTPISRILQAAVCGYSLPAARRGQSQNSNANQNFRIFD